MRMCFALIAGAWLLLGTGVSAPQSGTGPSTEIPRQKIASVLRQTMKGAPQETGGGLFDGDHYRIGVLKRKLPGEVEVHREDTDVIYILSGRATVVTGGTVVGQHAISDKEERGTAIRNGVRHQLGSGDMIVIPKGQPHWFQSVTGEVSYLVMKVQ